MKTCSRCREVKPLELFYVKSRSPDGRQPACKACSRIYNVAHYRDNKVVMKQRANNWRRNNRPAVNTWLRRKYYRKRYGLTRAQIDLMIASQGGICAIPNCGRPAKHMDHCHSTGKVRQVLCFQCNSALGGVNDNIPRILGLAEYIKRHS